MATLASEKVTLLDVAKRLDPDGSTSAVAELLSQENEILMDQPWYEGNLPTGHRVTVRTGLPESTWRKLNQGVAASKSRTAQIDEATAMLEQRAEIDKDIADLNGNTASFRLSENKAHIEAMNQAYSSNLFYGTSLTPERFVGFSERFNSLSAENGDNIINAGGEQTDNASIWLIGWGENSVYGIYPKGSTAGLKHEDLGLDDAFDENNRRYRAYMDHYQWKCGLCVKDWRYIVRVANIDISDLTKNAATGADVIDLMTQALEKIHSLSGVTPVFYMNRRLRSFLRRQTVNKVASSTLSYDMVGGKPALMFGEIPVRRVDALNIAESVVS